MNKYLHAIVFMMSVTAACATHATPRPGEAFPPAHVPSYAPAVVTGTVSDENGNPLPGVSVVVKGTSIGTLTDANGKFSLETSGNVVLVFSYVGYATQEVEAAENTSLAVTMFPSSQSLSEITVIGSRRSDRTALETPVPVDVIHIDAIVKEVPQVEVSQILNYLAPSFASNRQSIADGTDHVDPASLRGLGVDHVLVLINGKRRHNSALVNVNGSVGRGSAGTDLNTIPAAAIKRIEVLRDGAAAQYGSDAIAGVINIVLKDDTDQISTSLTTGQTYEGDGENAQFNTNYGFKIGAKGFVNLTGQYQYRGRTNRAGTYSGPFYKTNGTGVFSQNFAAGDFSPFDLGKRLTADEAASINAANAITNSLTAEQDDALIAANGGRKAFTMIIGDSEARNTALILNAVLPINDNQQFYVFGGINDRRGLSSGFYRRPNEARNLTSIYPNGFLPEINTKIFDGSVGAGIRGTIGAWKVDLSNTYGLNQFKYVITNTLNASMGNNSPNSFNSGGFRFQQNTTNLDFTRFFNDAMAGINVAFGAEYRVENYTIIPGEEASYRNYGNVPVIDNAGTMAIVHPQATTNIFYNRDGGAQVFPGFRPASAVDQSRSNVAAYLDGEFNFTEKFYLNVAGRFENYTDFGSTLNGKVAARWAFAEGFAVRGAASTGFRAPSLQQRYFNSTSTITVNVNGVLVPNEVGTFRNDSRLAGLLGIPSLTNESSVSYSAGFTGTFGDFSLSVDGYQILVDDRMALTGQFSVNSSPAIAEILQSVGASRAQLFVNAIDTKTQGIDVVLSNTKTLATNSSLVTTLAANFTKTSVEDVNIPALLNADPATFFSREERSRFETATPRNKVNLSIQYRVGRFSTNLTNVRFGEVTYHAPTADASGNFADQTYSAKVVTNLSIGFDITPHVNITLAGNNIFDVYPDENRAELLSSGNFKYSRNVNQFGYNGGYYSARLGVTF